MDETRARENNGGDNGCDGADCSKYTLKPFIPPKLINIKPEPAEAQKYDVETQAKLKMREKMEHLSKFLRESAAIGELWAIILQRFIGGWGGQEICEQYGDDCNCRPDMDNPYEIWTSPAVPITVEFEELGVKYTATFEYKVELDIVHGHCAELF